MKKLPLLILALISLGLSSARAELTYTYVGSWFVDDGPFWAATSNDLYTTPVYSGREAAALLFGGSANDYVISTVSTSALDINYKAWMDGWGDSTTYGYSGNPAPDDLHVDINNDGLYALPFTTGGSYSAYVSDHGVHLQNYAFRVSGDFSAVPEPSTYGLLGAAALAGLVLIRRRRR
ncbi:PEP-CTERM sorting domain-containing protein [Opitutaceae bacterium EW11]|nr:PEP-CTERM sorting domain-containing protein [Opitutaceae bacterium EW11]